MTTIFAKTLLVCLLTLPAAAFAAEAPTEVKPSAPQPQAVVSTPIAEAAVKPAAVSPTTRIGSVDFARIGTESERGKKLKALLTAKKDKLQGKLDGKKKQLEKLKTSLEAKIATLSQPQREAKAKEFQKKVEEFQKLAQSSEEELVGLQDKESKALFEAIEEAATAYGKANGFAAIVIKKELLYVGSSVEAQDVTEALIKALDQAGQKK